MKPRIGFVMEQALGHVAYGLGLRAALAGREDFDATWMDVPYGPGRFGKLPLLGRNWTLRGSTRAALAVRRQSEEHAFSAMFVHTQTVALFLRGAMRRIPTLLSLDATPINYDELAHHYGDKVHAAPIERVKQQLHRSVVQRAHRFTTWSEWAKRSLVKDYGAAPEHVTVIHPGTNLAQFQGAAERPRRDDGPLRVLFVGGDFKRKGGDLLLEAARRLKGRVELHLVTSAEVSPAEGVHVYRGLRPLSDELVRRYVEADVFALPTRADCLAVVLGEAMASSLPIITTRVGAHPEAVEDGASGFLLDSGDVEGLTDRLSRLAVDREAARRMGLRSRAVAEDRFDMHKNAARIAELLLAMRAPRGSEA